MIDFYTWITPNGLKVAIALEEMGLAYNCHTIDIEKGEQFSPAFLKINPAAKIPAIVDHNNGTVLTESSAILLYLAEKTGLFYPASGPQRLQVMEWLMWQSASLGPTLGYAHYFLTYHPDKAPFASERFHADVQRLYQTLEQRLHGRDFIAGAYSIADMAVWPWVSRFQRHHIVLEEFPNVQRWYRQIAQRPAVRRGYQVPHHTGPIPG